ncbi:MAG: hypothetical protein ACPGYT_09960 [Nitrospirales bacterium]
MAKSKARSLDEDKQILRKKVTETVANADDSKSTPAIRALRKRLKRVQRKVRSVKAREAKANPKKAVAAES